MSSERKTRVSGDFDRQDGMDMGVLERDKDATGAQESTRMEEMHKYRLSNKQPKSNSKRFHGSTIGVSIQRIGEHVRTDEEFPASR